MPIRRNGKTAKKASVGSESDFFLFFLFFLAGRFAASAAAAARRLSAARFAAWRFAARARCTFLPAPGFFAPPYSVVVGVAPAALALAAPLAFIAARIL